MRIFGKEPHMAPTSNTLTGYVKTSNMYLIVLVALAAGFLGGVVFSSYKANSSAVMPSGGLNPTGAPPMNKARAETLAALIQATRTTPDNVNAWTQLGDFYFDNAEPQKAIQAYRKSLELDGTRPDVWTDLGVMYRRAGEPVNAVKAFDHALTGNSHHEIALFNKGIVLLNDLNDPKGAIKSWERLIEINPNAKAPNGQTVQSMIDQIKRENQS